MLRWDKEASSTQQFWFDRRYVDASGISALPAWVGPAVDCANPILVWWMLVPLIVKARGRRAQSAHGRIPASEVAMAMIGTSLGVVAALPYLGFKLKELHGLAQGAPGRGL